MNAAILCVGRLKETWQRAGVEEYLKRLSRYGKYAVEQVDDAPDSLGARALEREGEALLKRIRPADHVIALCVEAEAPDSAGAGKAHAPLGGAGNAHCVGHRRFQRPVSGGAFPRE